LHPAGSQYLRKLQKDPETSHFANQWGLLFTGYTVIVNRLTNYTGATLVLPELELTFAYPPGTGIFLSGTLLKHKVNK